MGIPNVVLLEQHGYDVSYISNVDTHADPEGLLRAKGFISVGMMNIGVSRCIRMPSKLEMLA